MPLSHPLPFWLSRPPLAGDPPGPGNHPSRWSAPPPLLWPLLLANLYPYFVYTNTLGMDMSFALFTSPGTVVQDGEYGYQNLFDATVDALYTAVAKLGGSRVRVVVSETGWPTAGGAAASVENAMEYNQNLVRHVRKGTPRRPRRVEAYVFAMFNENLKEAGVEQSWGLFYPNMERVYPITFAA